MSSRRVVPNDILLGEICRLIEEGRSVVIGVSGESMLPFIKGGRDNVELVKADSVRVGDIVLARIENGGYVIHRVVSLLGDGSFLLMGDGNIESLERLSRQNIIARVVRIVTPKGDVQTQDRWFQFKSRVWRMLLPVRRLLLGAYYKYSRNR